MLMKPSSAANPAPGRETRRPGRHQCRLPWQASIHQRRHFKPAFSVQHWSQLQYFPTSVFLTSIWARPPRSRRTADSLLGRAGTHSTVLWPDFQVDLSVSWCTVSDFGNGLLYTPSSTGGHSRRLPGGCSEDAGYPRLPRHNTAWGCVHDGGQNSPVLQATLGGVPGSPQRVWWATSLYTRGGAPPSHLRKAGLGEVPETEPTKVCCSQEGVCEVGEEGHSSPVQQLLGLSPPHGAQTGWILQAVR
jgi:hypothetical protein